MAGPRIRDFLRNLQRDHKGVALVEFAVLCPVLFALYLGGAQLCEVIACGRKVTSTARAISDLTTQYSSVSGHQIDTIMAAASQIMYPYDGTKAMVRINEIQVNDEGIAEVVWSRASNGVPRTKSSRVAIDANLATPNTVYIYGEVEYKLRPSIPFVFKSDFQLNDSFVMLPRISTKVNCNDC